MEERVVSSFDVSIATGLALESLFMPTHQRYDNKREVPNIVNLDDYDEVYFNLTTLARNIVSSYSSNHAMVLKANEIAMYLNYEVEVIKKLFSDNTNALPLFYFSDYEHVYDKVKHPAVRPRLATTQRQKHLESLRDKAVDIYYSMDESSTLHYRREFLPNSRYPKALVLTSFPVDLCAFAKFKQLDLLESTTGVLKPRHLWYTKYYKGSDLNFLPMSHKLLKVFGDNVHYHPMDFKIRNMLIDLAKSSRWSPLTTPDKVLFDIEQHIKDKYFVEVFKLI